MDHLNAETVPSLDRGVDEALRLGHILMGVGAEHDPPIRLEEVRLIRHSFKPGDHVGLQGPEDLTPERVLAYTRV